MHEANKTGFDKARKAFKKGSISVEKRASSVQNTTVSEVIGTNGGAIILPDAGLHIQIPNGALDRDITFRVRAHDSVLGFTVEMNPTQTLKKDAVVKQEVSDEVIAKGDLYLCGTDSVGETASVNSFHAAQVHGNIATARVPHFSGYIIACGIQMGQPCNPEQDGPDCIWVD